MKDIRDGLKGFFKNGWVWVWIVTLGWTLATALIFSGDFRTS